MSYARYIFGRPRGRKIDNISFSSHLVIKRKYILYVSQFLVSLALCEISWIRAIAWILMHCKRVHNEPIPTYGHSWPQRQSVCLK